MSIPEIQFEPFGKISRFSRDVVVTEKIDGTNATVYIDEIGGVFAGSRTRWITADDDNYGFAAWVEANADQLRCLGAGLHRGEWWGSGIQRGYGLAKGEKRFSLFNVSRWCLHGTEPQRIATADPRIEKYQDVLPPCCGLVPVLATGNFSGISPMVESVMASLESDGSRAAPGFKFPEGVVVFHVAGNVGFKKTIDRDSEHKSA